MKKPVFFLQHFRSFLPQADSNSQLNKDKRTFTFFAKFAALLLGDQNDNGRYSKPPDITVYPGKYPGYNRQTTDLSGDGTCLYGMTAQGGAHGRGNIFKIKITGNSYSKIDNFNRFDGRYFNSYLISDGSSLDGITKYDGKSGVGAIFPLRTAL